MRKFLENPVELLGGAGRALSHRNYRFYALGHVLHVLGWWGNRMGLGWLTWRLTEQATWLGIITISGLIPVMVIAPLTGAIADRYGHRRTAMSAGLVGSAVTAAMATLILTGVMTLPLLVALTILQGLVFGLEFPARQALIPQLVGKANISAAVAFNATTFHLGQFLGPIIAASLIASINVGAALLLYSFTTLWMFLMLRLIDIDESGIERDEGANLVADLRAGFRYIRDEKALALLLLMVLVNGFFIRSYTEMLPGFADQVFNRGAEGLGALNATAGLGALAMSVVMVLRGRTHGLVLIQVTAAFATAAALIAFAATRNFNFALGILAVAAAGLLAAQVSTYSLVQTVARPDMRGRIISINVSLTMGGPALGALAVGSLADRIGLPGAVMAAGAAAAVVYAFTAPALLRRRTEMEIVEDGA